MSQAPKPGEPIRILYVEDDPTSARLVKAIAEKEGYAVSLATSRRECLKAMAEDPPGLLLIDLARHFLARSNRLKKSQVQGLAPRAMEALCGHAWPGNVRELQHAIERGVLVCDGEEIQPEHLPPAVVRGRTPTPSSGEPGGLIEAVERLERSMILAAMDKNGWVKSRAARDLGVTERILSYKMHNLGIEKL